MVRRSSKLPCVEPCAGTAFLRHQRKVDGLMREDRAHFSGPEPVPTSSQPTELAARSGTACPTVPGSGRMKSTSRRAAGTRRWNTQHAFRQVRQIPCMGYNPDDIRPPKPGIALQNQAEELAEGMRFELTVGLDTLRRFSKPMPSATRPPLRTGSDTHTSFARVLLRKPPRAVKPPSGLVAV